MVSDTNYQVGVGKNAFAHESGIHADGMLKDRRNYELYSPDELGLNPRNQAVRSIITTGEYGASKAETCIQPAGWELENERDILRLVQYAALRNQAPLTNDELLFIAKYPEEVEKILR